MTDQASRVGATSTFRGHPIVWRDEGWLYVDDGSPACFRGEIRPCVKCGLLFNGSTDGQPDPCLGNLPGVDNACCGHGDPSSAYIRFTNGLTVVGFSIEAKEQSNG